MRTHFHFDRAVVSVFGVLVFLACGRTALDNQLPSLPKEDGQAGMGAYGASNSAGPGSPPNLAEGSPSGSAGSPGGEASGGEGQGASSSGTMGMGPGDMGIGASGPGQPPIGVDGGPPGSSGAGPQADASMDAPDDINLFDIVPIPDSGPGAECASCTEKSCSHQVNICANNPHCVEGIACVFTKCVRLGERRLLCLSDCFQGDIRGALQALGAFQCIAQSCGPACYLSAGGGITNRGPVGQSPPSPAAAGAHVFPMTSDFARPSWMAAEPVVVPPEEAFEKWPGFSSSGAPLEEFA